MRYYKLKRRKREIDTQVLSSHVQETMQNPLYNCANIPDFIEYHIHKRVVESLIESIPPIDLYGHRIQISVSRLPPKHDE
jgi:hypothetical protein|uniref:Uncharacterized protein n=1 Tax=viral metagenome TaxID=1070528 RepID=A0A6C0IVN5_9ZZZZ